MSEATEQARQQLEQFRADFQTLRREIGKVIAGNDEIVDGTLTALIAGGHVPLEGGRDWAKRSWCARSPTRCTCGFSVSSSRPT